MVTIFINYFQLVNPETETTLTLIPQSRLTSITLMIFFIYYFQLVKIYLNRSHKYT
jgi:hypothetical protein